MDNFIWGKYFFGSTEKKRLGTNQNLIVSPNKELKCHYKQPQIKISDFWEKKENFKCLKLHA